MRLKRWTDNDALMPWWAWVLMVLQVLVYIGLIVFGVWVVIQVIDILRTFAENI